jgi:hypothetical protein
MFMTKFPDVPVVPRDFDEGSEYANDRILWVIYNMKELNLLLEAFVTGKLSFTTKRVLNFYFMTVKTILLIQLKTVSAALKQEGCPFVLDYEIERELRQTFQQMKDIGNRVREIESDDI